MFADVTEFVAGCFFELLVKIRVRVNTSLTGMVKAFFLPGTHASCLPKLRLTLQNIQVCASSQEKCLQRTAKVLSSVPSFASLAVVSQAWLKHH